MIRQNLQCNSIRILESIVDQITSNFLKAVFHKLLGPFLNTLSYMLVRYDIKAKNCPLPHFLVFRMGAKILRALAEKFRPHSVLAKIP